MPSPQSYFALSKYYLAPPASCLPSPPIQWLREEDIKHSKNIQHLHLVEFIQNKWVESGETVKKIKKERRNELLYLIQLRIELRRHGFKM